MRTAKVLGASERIGIGIIGLSTACGPGLHAHARQIQSKRVQNNVFIAAICDLFSMSRAVAGRFLGLKDSDVFIDYRELLERKDVDAVIAATHDPWHAQICLLKSRQWQGTRQS